MREIPSHADSPYTLAGSLLGRRSWSSGEAYISGQFVDFGSCRRLPAVESPADYIHLLFASQSDKVNGIS